MIEKVNGWNNSTNSKNIYLNRKAIHIHGGMERNLVRYARYYFCGSTIISGGSKFTRKFDYSRRIFFRH
jgi:hypothetical protein